MKILGLSLLFGFLGMVEDLIVSLYYRAIAERRAVRSAGISFVHTLLAIFVVASIITGKSFFPLLGYAVGGAVGTYLGVRRA